jgi:3',5'-cyclic AMP phosphodiesterase CpdA
VRARFTRITGLLAVVASVACLEYSPHALPDDASERNLNAKAIRRIVAQPPPAELRFAVIGDTQLFYDEAEDAVARLNAVEDLAFAVQIGDLTHFGVVQEFRLMNEILDRLHAPHLVVVGNHDLLGNGGQIYDRMFGPRDFEFAWGAHRFVFLDTNSREYGFEGVPRLGWLEAQLLDDGRPAVQDAAGGRTFVFAHVPPDDGDFHPDLRPDYLALVREGGVGKAFYGHQHRPRDGDHEGVPFHVADALDGRTVVVVTVRAGDGGVDVERAARRRTSQSSRSSRCSRSRAPPPRRARAGRPTTRSSSSPGRSGSSPRAWAGPSTTGGSTPTCSRGGSRTPSRARTSSPSRAR